jgi:hypothetical protein
MSSRETPREHPPSSPASSRRGCRSQGTRRQIASCLSNHTSWPLGVLLLGHRPLRLPVARSPMTLLWR